MPVSFSFETRTLPRDTQEQHTTQNTTPKSTPKICSTQVTCSSCCRPQVKILVFASKEIQSRIKQLKRWTMHSPATHRERHLNCGFTHPYTNFYKQPTHTLEFHHHASEICNVNWCQHKQAQATCSVNTQRDFVALAPSGSRMSHCAQTETKEGHTNTEQRTTRPNTSFFKMSSAQLWRGARLSANFCILPSQSGPIVFHRCHTHDSCFLSKKTLNARHLQPQAEKSDPPTRRPKAAGKHMCYVCTRK